MRHDKTVEWRTVTLLNQGSSPFNVRRPYEILDADGRAGLESGRIEVLFNGERTRVLHGSGWDMPGEFWATGEHLYLDIKLVEALGRENYSHAILRFDSDGREEFCTDLTELFPKSDAINIILIEDDNIPIYRVESDGAVGNRPVNIGECQPSNYFGSWRRLRLWFRNW